MTKEKAQKYISEKMAEIEATIEECSVLATEHNVSFMISFGGGCVGYDAENAKEALDYKREDLKENYPEYTDEQIEARLVEEVEDDYKGRYSAWESFWVSSHC